MDKDIEQLTKMFPGFDKLCGPSGMISISDSAISDDVVDIQVEWERGNGVQFDKEEITDIGCAFGFLASALRQKGKE